MPGADEESDSYNPKDPFGPFFSESLQPSTASKEKDNSAEGKKQIKWSSTGMMTK